MAGGIKVGRSGARTVELFMPYDYNGHRVEEVVIGPYVLDHTLRWKEAKYKDWYELMVDGITINGKSASSDEVRQLRYPDADRVVTNFIAELPSEIRDAVIGHMWPTREPAKTSSETSEYAMPEMPDEESQPQTDPMNIDG